RREIAMFVLSHALHIVLQRLTIGPALRRVLLVLAACGVGTLTYAFDAEETRTTACQNNVLPAAPIPPIKSSLRPPSLPRDLPPSSASLYSESELSSEEYQSDYGDSSEAPRMPTPAAAADVEQQHHHLLRPSYRGILRWFLDTHDREHELPVVGRLAQRQQQQQP
ncbi:hypothetical protein FOZ63_012869, partial [Perkinsus olseni]